MTNLLKLSALVLAGLLTGCATYEQRPVQHTLVSEYSHGPVTYYTTPPAYYGVPAPTTVYVSPPVYVGPPVYAAPAPAFNMQIQSEPNFRRYPHNRSDRRRLRARDADESQVGGPGWSGTVWSR